MISISKYHGCGNNFVIVRESDLPKAITMKDEAARIEMYSQLAVNLCCVNTGEIGRASCRERV